MTTLMITHEQPYPDGAGKMPSHEAVKKVFTPFRRFLLFFTQGILGRWCWRYLYKLIDEARAYDLENILRKAAK
jgi:hypothetical protein